MGRRQEASIWHSASKLLGRSVASKVEVNVGRISRTATEGEVLFVPGKVLGSGRIEKKVIVGAFSFSAAARSKILASGGSALSVEQFVRAYPKGSGVRLVE
jgi:large subunit ribosomal protein L18e